MLNGRPCFDLILHTVVKTHGFADAMHRILHTTAPTGTTTRPSIGKELCPLRGFNAEVLYAIPTYA